MNKGRNNTKDKISVTHHLKLSESTRFRLSIFVAILLTITGVLAYIYDPYHIDKFAFYTINMVLPIITYVIGRTIKGGVHSRGILTNPGTRYRTALYTFLISLFIGILSYIFSPENIDKLGMYMIGVTLPIMSIILGQSFRMGGDDKDNLSSSNYTQSSKQYPHYDEFGVDHGDISGYGYSEYIKASNSGMSYSIIDGDKDISDYNNENM